MPDPTHPVPRLRAASGLLLIAVAGAIVGCGAPTASVAAPASAATAAPTTEPSAAPTEAASATASAIPESPPASFVVPSLGADTALIDVLPDELGGAPTQTVALVGTDLSALEPSAAMVFDSLLNVLGSESADLTAAAALNGRASIIAVRVADKSAKEVGEAMIAGRALNATTTKDELDLGGKHVIKVTTTTAPVPFYVYETGDVAFTVAAADETIVAEALSKLP